MKKILHLDSSARHDSDSRAMTAAIVATLRERHPGLVVVRRDLVENPPSPMSQAWIAGAYGGAEAAALVAMVESDRLVDEVLDADVIVMGVPMYNFSIPSSVKAWIDQIVRVGRTFSYDGGRPAGLLPDRPVYVCLSRGGEYSPGSAMASFDFQEPYLRHILGFIGLRDIHLLAHVHDQDAARNAARLEASRSLAVALVGREAVSA